MLEITIPKIEGFNDRTNEFVTICEETKLLLEHSLLSLSKWESKWHKPFLDDRKERTTEETIDYIRCMTISPKHVGLEVYKNIPQHLVGKISDYIDDSMTATWINDVNKPSKQNAAVVTSEVIYYWMITYNIPFDPCEKWHLNRLITLIRVCSEKNSPKKKMSREEIYERNRRLNEQRRVEMNSKG